MVAQESGDTGSVLVQLVPAFAISLILVFPFIRILRRAGRSSWWALFLVIPFFGWLVLPWLIAFLPWERSKEELDQVFR